MGSDNTDTGTCAYYRERNKLCSVGFCKLNNLCKDGKCKTNGKIVDIFRERNVTNYEFMKNRYTE